MSFADNLAVAGIIVGVFAIAVFYLWPDRKWIGWAAFIFTIVSVTGSIFVNIGGLVGSIIAGAVFLTFIGTLVSWLLKPKRRHVPDLEAIVRSAEYPPGTRLGKILWNSRFTDLRLSLRNHGGTDLEDIDLVLQLDEAIAAMDQVTHLPDVFISPAPPADEPFSVELLERPTGKRTMVPLGLIASTIGYRVQCKKVPRKQRLELVLAIVSMQDLKAGPPKVQKPNGSVFDQTYAIKVDFKNEQRTSSSRYGHRRNADGPIEEVYSPNRPIPKAIQVDGTYKIKGQEEKLSQRLQVRDPMEEIMPKIREDKRF
jgi:hypothetical protein